MAATNSSRILRASGLMVHLTEGFNYLCAVRAEKIGLAHRVVLASELVTAAQNIARGICEGGPGAIAETKALLGRLAARPLAEDFAIALETHSRTRDSDEAREGSRAFVEKRKPSWSEKH